MSYARVLRQPELKAVLVAHAVSLTGSVAAEVALSVLVYTRTASPFLSSLTLACAFVPQALSAVLLSGHVDRIPPRRLLVSCDLACAALVALMVVRGLPVAGLLLLAAAVGLLTPLFGGARSAVLADLLDAEAFVAARSLLRVLSQSALLLGFAVGGAALAVLGPRTLLALDAGSFLASAALLRWGTSEHRPRAAGARPSPADSLRGVVEVLGRAPLRRLLLLTWLPAAFFSTVDALATPYVGGQGREVGLLLGAAALGTITAEWLGIRLRVAERPALLLPLALLTGAALMTYATHPVVRVAVLLNLVGGLGSAVGQWVDGQVLVELPEDLRGRLFALQSGFMMAVQGLGIGLAGALAEAVPPYLVLAAAGALSALTVLALLRPAVARAAARASVPSPA